MVLCTKNPITFGTCVGSTGKVAAITSASPTPEHDVIAAILDNEENTVDWASSSEEEDNNIHVSDYCTPHLHLKCFVHGINHCSVIVNTFLDNGTYLLLIHPDLVHQLRRAKERGKKYHRGMGETKQSIEVANEHWAGGRQRKRPKDCLQERKRRENRCFSF